MEKAIEVYERSRDRFAALLPDDQFCDMNGIVEPEEKLAVRASFIVDGLRKLEAPSEPYDGLKWIVDLAMIPPSPPCSPPGSPTPPASPMMDVEEVPPLSLPPSALSFLADVSGFKAEFDDRTTSLQAISFILRIMYSSTCISCIDWMLGCLSCSPASSHTASQPSPASRSGLG